MSRLTILKQLLVVVKIAIGNQHDHTEMFLTYHDIFVRNAFGNYRDILKEISYSSLVSEEILMNIDHHHFRKIHIFSLICILPLLFFRLAFVDG